MSLSRSESRAIASRYVSAMFDLALQQSAIDAVAGDLLSLKGAITASSELEKLLHNPVISDEDKAKAFAAILQKLGAQKLTIDQVTFVIHNGRVATLPDIADLFEEARIAHKGERSAEIISARPLSASQRRDIAKALKDAAGQTVNLTERVDPSILGGLIIHMGSQMLDRSVAGRLQRLKNSLKTSAA